MPNASPTLTFVFNDPPHESARGATALRLVDAALRKGYDVNVFVYGGAAAPPADHPSAALRDEAERLGRRLHWVACGPSPTAADRGAAELRHLSRRSVHTLVVPAK